MFADADTDAAARSPVAPCEAPGHAIKRWRLRQSISKACTCSQSARCVGCLVEHKAQPTTQCQKRTNISR